MGFGDGGIGPIAGSMANMYLQQFLGPTNFLPYGVPAQAANDQLVMREYQQQTMANTRNSASAGNKQMSQMLLGLRSFATGGAPATEMNQQQAGYISDMINNPHIKPFVAAAMGGQDNFEAAFFGRAGDPSSLAATSNRLGYYRRDSDSGAERMDAQSLEDFSSSLYSTLYQPHGDVKAMTRRARSDDDVEAAEGMRQLRTAANDTTSTIVDDSDVADRLTDLGADQVQALYKSYQPKGEATTVEAQAKELVKFNRAVDEAGVLERDETTVGQLEKRAKDRALNEMHGFGAGQAGQIAEQLFQRGMLPQSMGSLSPAERVRLIANEDVSDTELNKMATDFARRDLESRGDQLYSQAKERGDGDKYLAEKVGQRGDGGYLDRVSTSLDTIRSEGRPGAPLSAEKAEQLLQMDGASTAASHVDARRAGDVVKQHAATLDAIREIFGDSGNPNAPVPALMAALDHLSQGATHQMGTSKVESTLREMRGTAKSLGMNFTDLANFSGAMGAYGDTLGVSAPSKLAATNNALAALRVMDEGGAFSQTRFGTLSRGEMEQQLGMSVMRAEASSGNKAMAAIAREFKTNAGRYKNEDGSIKEDNELAVIASKLEDPTWSGDYEFNGEKKNFFTQLAEGGPNVAYELAEQSGMGRERMISFMGDSDTAQYAQHNIGAQMAMQRAEFIQKTGSQFVRGEMAQNMKGTTFGADTPEAAQMREKLSKVAANKILDTSLMSNEDQLDALQKDLVPEFKKAILEANPGMTDADAQSQAEAAFTASFGGAAGSDEARANLSQVRSDMNTASVASTGMSLSALAQREVTTGGKPMSVALAEDQRRRAAGAERSARLSGEFSGSPLARFGDYMAEIGESGEAPTFERMMKSVFNVKSEDDILERIAPELVDDFKDAHKQLLDSSVTEEYVNTLAGGGAELRELATRGMSDKEREEFGEKFKTHVDDAALRERRQGKIDTLAGTEEGRKKLAEIGTRLGMSETGDALVAALKGRGEELAGIYEFGDDQILAEGEYSTAQEREAALRRSGGFARAGQEEERRRAMLRTQALGGDAQAMTTHFNQQIKDATGGRIDDEKVNELRRQGLSGKSEDVEAFGKSLDQMVAAGTITKDQQAELLAEAETNRLALKTNTREVLGDQTKTPEEVARQRGRTARDPRPGTPDPEAADGTAAPGAPPAADGTAAPGATPDGAATPPPDAATAPGANETADRGGDEMRALTDALRSLEGSFGAMIAKIEEAAKTIGESGSPEADERRDVAQVTNTRGAPATTVAQQRPAPPPRSSGGGGGGEITGQLRLLNLHTAIIAMRGDPMHVPDGDGGVSIAANSVPSPPYATTAGMA
jgi:hypothetical protein